MLCRGGVGWCTTRAVDNMPFESIDFGDACVCVCVCVCVCAGGEGVA